MKSPIPVFLGFRMKRVLTAPDWLKAFGGSAGNVVEVCSVSDCMAEAPSSWAERGSFNWACCFDTEELALATVPSDEAERYELFAYRMFLLEFGKAGALREIELAREFPCPTPLPVEPDPSAYRSIGYDVAGRPFAEQVVGFGHSPLSCNGCAAAWHVNRYCLLDDLCEAIEAGKKFSRSEPEPGPFCVYEVLRKRSHRFP